MEKSTFLVLIGYFWGIFAGFLLFLPRYWKAKEENKRLTTPRPLADPDVSDEDVEGLPD